MKRKAKSNVGKKPLRPQGAAGRIAALKLDRAEAARLGAGAPLGWYVVCTATGQEAKAESSLMELGFDLYLPRGARWKQTRAGRARAEEPWFPGYLFVCAGRREFGEVGEVWYAHGPALAKAWSAKGVEGVLSSGGRPWPVQGGLVDVLREAEMAGEFDLTVQVRRTFRKGQKVRITTGPWVGYVGQIAAAPDARERVKVMLAGLFKGGVPVPLDSIEAA